MRSLDFVKERIASGKTALTDIKWSRDFIEVDFKLIYKNLFGVDFPNKGTSLKHEDILVAEFIYDPNADFNYFATSKRIHDGTLLFVYKTFADLYNSVFTCCTYNKEVIEKLKMHEKNPNFYKKYHFKYTVGDIVCGTEIDGDYVPKDKKWMRERTTAMLPIKFEIVENIVWNEE